MKTEQEIKEVLDNPALADEEFSGMSFEEGIEEALRWVLEEISDAEFEFSSEQGSKADH